MANHKVGRYGKVFAFGHRATRGLLDENCIIEEKLDGSQLSFQVVDGNLHIRSKGVAIVHDVPNLFTKAVETFRNLHAGGQLRGGWIYRGEAFRAPRHNTLTYNRIPVGGFALFDVDFGGQDYAFYGAKIEVARELGLEVVPLIYMGMVTKEVIEASLDRESMLGGPKVEGVVVKRQTIPLFGLDGLPVRAKYVSEAFKEKHTKNPEYRKKKKVDIVDELVSSVSTEARWLKSVQHMREEDVLTNEPKDIGPLIKRIQQDILDEELEWIKDQLWNHYKKLFMRKGCAGIAGWYKQQLLDNAWGEEDG